MRERENQYIHKYGEWQHNTYEHVKGNVGKVGKIGKISNFGAVDDGSVKGNIGKVGKIGKISNFGAIYR